MNSSGGAQATQDNELCRGIAKLVKAPDFDSGMRRFESFLPSQIDKERVALHAFIF